MDHPAYQPDHLLELMFENNHMPVALMDTAFNFLRVNKAYAAADNKTPEYFVGKNHFDLFPNEDNERIFNQVVKTGEKYYAKAKPFEYEHNPERGLTHWDWSLVPVHEGENLVGVMLQLVDVTEHIEREEKLNVTSNLLDSILENVPNMIFLKTAEDLRFQFFNKAGETLLGLNRDELLGRNDYDLFPDEQADFFTKNDRAVLDSQDILDIPEEEIETKNGVCFLHTKKIAIRDKLGKAQYLLGISEDITERVKAYQALSASEGRFQLLNSRIPGIIYQFKIDRNGKRSLPYVSPTIKEYMGVSAETAMQDVEKWFELTYPDDLPGLEASIMESFKNLSYWEWQGRFLKDGKEIRWLKGSALPEKQEDGSVLWNGVLIDFTDNKEAENALLESEARQNHLLTSSPVVIYTCDIKDNFAATYVSENIKELFGFDANELVGNKGFWTGGIHPEDKQRVFAEMGALFDKGEHYHEYRFKMKDGSYHWIQDKLRLNYDKNGEPCEAIGYWADINDKKNAETELLRQQEIITNLTDNLPGMIYQCRNDNSWTLDFANVGVKEVTGYDREELLSNKINYANLIHPDDQDLVWLKVQEALDSKAPFTIRYRIFNADQQVRWVWERGAGFFNQFGELEFLHGFITDITEQKEIEDQLEQHRNQLEELVEQRTQQLKQAHNDLLKSERLAVLGQLTATVGHELRNPLGAIWTSTYLIDKQIDKKNEKLRKSMERIKRNISHCDTIIGELLDFTYTRELVKEKVAIDDWLEELLTDFQWKDDVENKTVLTCRGKELLIDENRLQRVVVNALQNAQQALQIDKNRGSKPQLVTIKTACRNGRFEIHVIDNGPGIPKELLSKIFEPLFSTKSFGVGLGMNVIQQVMQQHDGGVEIKSEEGVGTEVILWLPEIN